MNKKKLFIENFLIYGFGGIISKIIPLIMVPIVTRIMPNSYFYGINDLTNTLISFGSAIGIMGMYDAMYRLFFENTDQNYQKKVWFTAFSFTLFFSFGVSILIILFRNQLAIILFGDTKYTYLILISALASFLSASNSIISAPTRMQNKRSIFLVANMVSPLVSYGIAIPLLLRGYYIIALPMAAVISALLLECSFAFMNRQWFHISRVDIQLLKRLLVLAIPLLPNVLIYWIFNSSDRIMISNLIGPNEAGVYAVGAKLGHCSQLIYTAFAGGWQYFAFSTMREKNQVKTNSKIFEILGIISLNATILVCSGVYEIYNILFPGDYKSGFIIAPYLFLAPLLQMLNQVIDNQFLVVKKTWPSMIILSIGAASNIVLNFLLIPRMGIEGAAIATLAGYFISVVVCAVTLIRMKLFIVSRKFLLCGLLFVIFFCVWRICWSQRLSYSLIGTGVFVFLESIVYRTEILNAYARVKSSF